MMAKKYIIYILFITFLSWFAKAFSNPVVISHRGAPGYLPEHTLEGEAMAYAMGTDYIEQDTALTKDNVPIVIHDITLDDISDVAQKFPSMKRKDGHYYAIDFTLKQIKTLTVKERFNSETNAPVYKNRFPETTKIDFSIPTLEESLTMIQGLNKSTGRNVGVYTEIKEPAFHNQNKKNITKIVIQILTKYKYNSKDSNAVLQIFDYDAVKDARTKYHWKGNLTMLIDLDGQKFKKNDSATQKWLLTEDGIKEASKYVDMYGPWIPYLIYGTGKNAKANNVVATLKKNGIKIHPYTFRSDDLIEGFNSPEDLLDVLFKEVKVDGIFTDQTDVVVKYLKKNNLR